MNWREILTLHYHRRKEWVEPKEMAGLAVKGKPSILWERIQEKAMGCLWNWRRETHFQ